MHIILHHNEPHYLSTPEWATGIYFIKCLGEDGREMSTYKLIKAEK